LLILQLEAYGVHPFLFIQDKVTVSHMLVIDRSSRTGMPGDFVLFLREEAVALKFAVEKNDYGGS
jgi:hypothetical protein